MSDCRRYEEHANEYTVHPIGYGLSSGPTAWTRSISPSGPLQELDNSLLDHIKVVLHVCELITLLIGIENVVVDLLLVERLVPGNDLEDGTANVALTVEFDLAASARDIASCQGISCDAALG
jgi:hypothetical protein